MKISTLLFCVLIVFLSCTSDNPTSGDSTNQDVPVVSIDSDTLSHVEGIDNRGLSVDDEGNIFIVDHGAWRIRMFDESGEPVRTIGRQGEGPGEFSEKPLTVDASGGNVYVGEMPSSRRINAYDENLDPYETIHTDGAFLNLSFHERTMFVPTAQVEDRDVVYEIRKREGGEFVPHIELEGQHRADDTTENSGIIRIDEGGQGIYAYSWRGDFEILDFEEGESVGLFDLPEKDEHEPEAHDDYGLPIETMIGGAAAYENHFFVRPGPAMSSLRDRILVFNGDGDRVADIAVENGATSIDISDGEMYFMDDDKYLLRKPVDEIVEPS